MFSHFKRSVNVFFSAYIAIIVVLSAAAGECVSDAQRSAEEHVMNKDGSPLITNAWDEGQAYTLICKQNIVSMAWSNNVRRASL